MFLMNYSYHISPHYVLTVYPLKTLITTAQRALTAQRKARLTCKSSGSRPAAVIRWYKDDVELKTVYQNISSDNVTTISVVTFTPTARDNGRTIRCVAENPKLGKSKVEDHRELNVFCKSSC